LRADWEDRLEAVEQLVELGQYSPEALDARRVEMQYELDNAETILIASGGGGDLTLKDMWEERAEIHGVGPPKPLAPSQLDQLQQGHVDWLDEAALKGWVDRDSLIWRWRLSLLPQHAVDLVSTLVGRARQAGRARSRERRSRRSGSSRDGPDEPPDDPDDLGNRARRGGPRDDL
jgi:hypothetical protein